MSASVISTIISVVLLCFAAALAYSMRKNRNNPGSVYTKALFRIKSVRFFPVVSLAYAFFAAVILFFALLAADKVNGYAEYFREETVMTMLTYDKYDHIAHFQEISAGLHYPLVAIRDGTPIPQKTKPRILVIGDSFVWGAGLTNINQIWWRHMSCELERRGYDCEIYAAGFPGASTYDELLWLRDTTLLEDIQPDLILIGYVANDPDLAGLGLGIDYHIPKYAQLGNGGPRLFPSLYYWLSMEINVKVSLTENRFNNSEYGYSVLSWEQKLAQGGNLENYSNYVVRPLAELQRDMNIPLIIIPTPPVPDKSFFSPYYEHVIPLFEEAGLAVYNQLDMPIEQYFGAEYKHFTDGAYTDYFHASPIDGHPGPASSRFLGRYAADVLEQNYASVLGGKGNWDKSVLSVKVNDWMPYMLEPRAMQEGSVSQYIIAYPSSETADVNWDRSNFLTYPLSKKHVKLNFKYPVKLSSIQMEGENLLSAEVYTLGINEELGFDDQRPVGLGKRRGSRCAWDDGSGRCVTSLLIRAETKDGEQASLTITIESEGGEEAFY